MLLYPELFQAVLVGNMEHGKPEQEGRRSGKGKGDAYVITYPIVVNKRMGSPMGRPPLQIVLLSPLSPRGMRMHSV